MHSADPVPATPPTAKAADLAARIAADPDASREFIEGLHEIADMFRAAAPAFQALATGFADLITVLYRELKPTLDTLARIAAQIQAAPDRLHSCHCLCAFRHGPGICMGETPELTSHALTNGENHFYICAPCEARRRGWLVALIPEPGAPCQDAPEHLPE